jgi:ABC-2 type transport system permease protein
LTSRSSKTAHGRCRGGVSNAVEFIRFGLYGQVNWPALAIVVGCTAVFMAIAILGYDPARGFMQAKRGG